MLLFGDDANPTTWYGAFAAVIGGLFLLIGKLAHLYYKAQSDSKVAKEDYDKLKTKLEDAEHKVIELTAENKSLNRADEERNKLIVEVHKEWKDLAAETKAEAKDLRVTLKEAEVLIAELRGRINKLIEDGQHKGRSK